MSVPHMLLGLLEAKPRHGYTLKSCYDSRFGRARPLRYGQVYATLERLQRDELAEEVAVEAGGGPDRRLYAVTKRGAAEVASWLTTPEPPTQYAQAVLFAKTVLALMSGRDAAEVLDAQRLVYLARMREVTHAARDADMVDKLAADYEMAHLDADLRWIETAGQRLDALRVELTGASA
jgi:DNA-binding PadR family transcriptional regulator